MALVECYECGGKVSTSAAACPHCGAPSKQQRSIAETDNLIKDSAVTAADENKDTKRISGILDGDVNQTAVKEKTKRIYGWIFAAGLVLVFLVVVILITQSRPRSPETVSLINSEGSTVSCSPRDGDTCVSDAEAKGFVKLSDAVAGIKVDWNAKPLKIIEVRGTAVQAGVRNGDILIELDGNKIAEPLSIFILMGTKQPGDQLKVKVIRDGTPMDFVYNVMPRHEIPLSLAPANPPQSDALPRVTTETSPPASAPTTEPIVPVPSSSNSSRDESGPPNEKNIRR
jgi:hypothetical protein